MRRSMRCLLLWLLALALPLQGVAATIGHCATFSLSVRAAATAFVPAPAPARASPPDASPSAHASHTSHTSYASHTSHCAHAAQAIDKVCCGACCVPAAAMSAAALPLPQGAVERGAPPAPPARPVLFLTDGPDRPPHAALA